MERLLLALEAENVDFAKEIELDAYVIVFNNDLKTVATKILYELRGANLTVDANYTQKAFKGQLKQALRMNAKYLVIIGEEEYKKGVVGIKNTKTEVQEEVLFAKIKKYLLEKLEKK